MGAPIRLFTIAAAAVAATCVVGPAAGYWRAASGVGFGTGSVASQLAVSLSVGTTTRQLYPTGTAIGGVALRLTNPNAFPVRVARLVLDPTRGTGGYAVDSAHAACTVSSLAYVTQTNGGAGWTVPASGSIDVDLANSIALATAAPAACAGATFTVFLTS